MPKQEPTINKMEIFYPDDPELEITELDERDIDYHRWYLTKVYAGMLRDHDVIERCEQIFRRTLRKNFDFVIY